MHATDCPTEGFVEKCLHKMLGAYELGRGLAQCLQRQQAVVAAGHKPAWACASIVEEHPLNCLTAADADADRVVGDLGPDQPTALG